MDGSQTSRHIRSTGEARIAGCEAADTRMDRAATHVCQRVWLVVCFSGLLGELGPRVVLAVIPHDVEVRRIVDRLPRLEGVPRKESEEQCQKQAEPEIRRREKELIVAKYGDIEPAWGDDGVYCLRRRIRVIPARRGCRTYRIHPNKQDSNENAKEYPRGPCKGVQPDKEV